MTRGARGSVLTQEICSNPKAFIFAARRTGTGRSDPLSGPCTVRMIVCSGGKSMEGFCIPWQDITRLAAPMTGRGTSLKAHQLIGAHLKPRQVDFEHLFG